MRKNCDDLVSTHTREKKDDVELTCGKKKKSKEEKRKERMQSVSKDLDLEGWKRSKYGVLQQMYVKGKKKKKGQKK